jgi:hypothetical protein
MRRFIKKVALLLAVYGILLIFLVTTNPQRLPLPLLILPFGLIFGSLFLPIWLFLYSTSGPNKRRKKTILAVGVATLPTLTLVLASIDQLTVRDVILLGALGLGILFYVSRINVNQR